MARIVPVLKALASASWRAQRSAESIASNNFFLMSLLFLQRNGTFLYLLAGLFLLFPLSADPLHRIPVERLGLWPLTHRERRWLRVLSPWVSPGSWIIVALGAAALRSLVGFDLLLLLVAICATGFALSFAPQAERGGALRFVPVFPGRWGQLVRKNVRQMLAVLDTYIALALAIGGVVYRWVDPSAPAEASEGLTLLVLLALSTYAQCLFGLDGPGGQVRYRLLPMRGWMVLASKDAAFLLIAVIFTAPLDPAGGLAGAFTALTIGHQPSVRSSRPQARWRFSSGAGIGVGLIQTVLMVGAAVSTSRTGLPILALAFAAWIVSLWWFGRVIDRAGGIQ